MPEPAVLFEKKDGMATLTLQAGIDLPTKQALDKELEIGISVQMSEDATEGTKAFKEKRTRSFKGR